MMIGQMSYKLLALVCVLLLMIGIALGWMGFLLFGDVAQQTQVVVVSKSAITNLEKERLKIEGGDMFFGKSDEALRLMTKLVNNIQNRKVKVVFVSDDTGNCSGAIPISAEVHRAVIAEQKSGAKDVWK